MNRRHTLTLAATITAAALALTGCGDQVQNQDSGPVETGSSNPIRERTVQLSDGRTVTCLTYKDYNAGGLDCDWDGER